MGLDGFAPKSSKFKATLVGGRRVLIKLRPFTLADAAWFQSEFTEKDQIGLGNMEVEPVCRAVWQMMDSESKEIFSSVKFTHFNDVTEQEETVDVYGYEKLVHSFADEETIFKAIEALSESRGLNGFSKKKKKAPGRKLTNGNGLLSMIGLRRRTA